MVELILNKNILDSEESRYIHRYIYFIDGNNSLRFTYGWLMVFNATFNNISVISEMTQKKQILFF